MKANADRMWLVGAMVVVTVILGLGALTSVTEYAPEEPDKAVDEHEVETHVSSGSEISGTFPVSVTYRREKWLPNSTEATLLPTVTVQLASPVMFRGDEVVQSGATETLLSSRVVFSDTTLIARYAEGARYVEVEEYGLSLPRVFNNDSPLIYDVLDWSHPILSQELVGELMSTGVVSHVESVTRFGRAASVAHLMPGEPLAPSVVSGTIAFDDGLGIKLDTVITHTGQTVERTVAVSIGFGVTIDPGELEIDEFLSVDPEIAEVMSVRSSDIYDFEGELKGISAMQPAQLTTGHEVKAGLIVTDRIRYPDSAVAQYWVGMQEVRGNGDGDVVFLHADGPTVYPPWRGFETFLWAENVSVLEHPNVLESVYPVNLVGSAAGTMYEFNTSQATNPRKPFRYLVVWQASDEVRSAAGGTWEFSTAQEFVDVVNEFLSEADIFEGELE